MYDVIWGDVLNVVDGDTFDLRVTHHAEHNKFRYNNQERIRIAEIDAPELATIAGVRAKQHLERAINGKRVKCDVHSRDTYHRLICAVSKAN